jgi:hypothetical protein
MIKQGQTILASDFIITPLAGENLSANDAVYISSADGKAYKCDADDLAKIGFVGFVQEAVTSGNASNILTWGVMGGFSSLTIGVKYYVSGTSGAITSTKPTNFKIVGEAISATQIKIATFLTHKTIVYGSNSTWTKPAGLKYVIVEVVGAGGGGSSGFWNAGGATGGASSFGTHAVGNGGSGANNGTSGGSASNGDVNMSGQRGGHAYDAIGGGGSSAMGKSGGDGGSVNAGNSSDNGSTGGGGGGYSRKLIQAEALGATETVTVGTGGAGGVANNSYGGNGEQGVAGIVIVQEFY